MYLDAFLGNILEIKCERYMKDNLRAPPQALVRQWGKQLKMAPVDVEHISDRLKLRFALGKDIYYYTSLCYYFNNFE
jgi:hypothetical protein